MNMINSIILEGVVSEGVSETGLFRVKSERHTKVGETNVTTTVEVLCQAPEIMLESVKAFGKVGRSMRIVGRLEYLYGNEVGIFVEHLEYKPDFPKAKRVGKYNFKQD